MTGYLVGVGVRDQNLNSFLAFASQVCRIAFAEQISAHCVLTSSFAGRAPW